MQIWIYWKVILAFLFQISECYYIFSALYFMLQLWIPVWLPGTIFFSHLLFLLFYLEHHFVHSLGFILLNSDDLLSWKCWDCVLETGRSVLIIERNYTISCTGSYQCYYLIYQFLKYCEIYERGVRERERDWLSSAGSLLKCPQQSPVWIKAGTLEHTPGLICMSGIQSPNNHCCLPGLELVRSCFQERSQV